MSACRSCGAPIVWVTTVNGKRMPVDADPVPDGTLVLLGTAPGDDTPTALQYVASDEPTLPGMPGPLLYRSHFATCPHADEHRRTPDRG